MKEFGALDPQDVVSLSPEGQHGYAQVFPLEETESCSKLLRMESEGEGKPIDLGMEEGDDDGVDDGEVWKNILMSRHAKSLE